MVTIVDTFKHTGRQLKVQQNTIYFIKKTRVREKLGWFKNGKYFQKIADF